MGTHPVYGNNRLMGTVEVMRSGIKLHLEALRLGSQIEGGLITLESAADELLGYARARGDEDLLGAVVEGLRDNPWNFTSQGYPAHDAARLAYERSSATRASRTG